MEIQKQSFDDFSSEMKSGEDGIVLLGAGGDLNEWVNGVTNVLQQEGIIPSGEAKDLWKSAINLTTTGGRNDLVLVFKRDVKYDLAKMAMWRIRFGGCSWWSDYVNNYASQHVVGGED